MPAAAAEPRSVRAAVDVPYWAGVGALTAGVAVFLLVQLHAWPPHEDETLALFVGRQPLGDLFDTVLGQRGGAPLHFLLTHLVALVSPGLTGLRLLSVLFAVLSIPAIAQLVARLSDRRTALVATLLVATSWVTLFHGIYGRMYSLFLFTSVLSFLALLHALAHGGARRWVVWGAVMLATLASMPYGAFVLAIQAVYVLVRRLRVPFSPKAPLLAFAAVTVLALPLWRTYLVLASRFDVGVGGRSSLGSPLDVLDYVRTVLGDFTAGWPAAFAPIALLALVGLVALARTRPPAALLAGAVLAVPTAGLALARLGNAAVPETRHLIFALPFFAMLVASGLLRVARAGGPAALALPLAALVSAQLAWGYAATPSLYSGEAEERAQARHAAAEWLAETARPDDVLFGYNPLFLEAWERGGAIGETVVPRADAELALETLEAAAPLGRGVWVHDATNNGITPRYEIDAESAGARYETRAFGPFLVLRSKTAAETPARFLLDTVRIQALGLELGVGDAELNHFTAVRALNLLDER